MTTKAATKTLNKPCSTKGWCPAMKEALDGDMASKRAGFQMAHMFKTTGDRSLSIRAYIVYRPQVRKSRAIILNVCPWCRVELDPICNPSTKKRAKKAKTNAS